MQSNTNAFLNTCDNTAGNLITKTISGAGTSARITNYEYSAGFVTSETSNSGQKTIYEYDNYGNVGAVKTLRGNNTYDITRMVYDKYDRVLSETNLLLSDSVEIANKSNVTDADGYVQSKTEYTYDVSGNTTSIKRPGAFADTQNAGLYTTTYSYDNLHRLVSATTSFHNGTDVEQISSSYTYDAVGNQTSVTDTRGGVTEYTYDAVNRVATVTNANDAVTSYTYDYAGNKVSEVRPGGTWSYEYDKLNRLVTSLNPSNQVISRLVYDDNNNVIKKIDANGYNSANNDNDRYGTTYTYNKSNMVTSVTMPEGGMSQYEYNVFGEVTKQIDALDYETSYTYDLAGNLSSVTDALNHTTSYTYDSAGNRTSVTDAKGNVTSYQYGAFNMLMSETDATDRITSYRYNLDGKITKMVDRIGNTTSYSYDSRGVLTEASVLLKNETAVLPENHITYQYDSAGNRTAMTDISGEYTYTYDILNRLTSISKSGVVQLSYTYTAENSIASVSYGGTTTNYTYDTNNRLTSVRNSGKGADYSYDQSGNVTQIQYVGGVKETMTYNKNNAVTSVTNTNPTDLVISNYSYSYDLCGRQTKKTDASGETTYTYDAAGHIQQVTAPGKTTTFAYDEVGNRIGMTEESSSTQDFPYTFDQNSSNVVQYDRKEVSYTYSLRNELLSVMEEYENDTDFVARRLTDYSYDDNGNQYMTVSGLIHPAGEGEHLYLNYGESTNAIYSSATESAFDGFNRLKSYTRLENTSSLTTSYMYNGDGLRTQKTETNLRSNESKTTNYIYDGQHVVSESGSSTATYVRGLSYIGKIGTSNEVAYYLYNAHGDVTQVVDAAGVVKNQYDYTVFGEKTVDIEAVENSIQYAGEFYDSSAELYYLRARYYSPETGRFISEDSYKGDSKNPASLNLYTYCQNDPVNHIDPTGHITQQQQHLIDMAEQAYQGGYISYEYYAENVRRNGGTPISSPRPSGTTLTNRGTRVGAGSGSRGGAAPSSSIAGFSQLSGRQQSNIQSAYDAWQGGYISYEEYVENVKLNGGTLAKIEPVNGTDVTFTANNIQINISNYADLSETNQISSKSTIDAYIGGYISAEEAIYSLETIGASLSVEKPVGVLNAFGADTSYNGTGFGSFLEFYTYTLVEPEEVEMILYRLNDTNQAYLDQTVNDYVYHQGGIKRGNNNIFQVIYSCPPGGSGTDNSRYEDASGYYQYVSSDRNIYDNYEFTLFDALNWMIQTGGTGNFVLQTRVTRDPSEAATEQRHIVGKFMDARNFMRRAKVIGEDVTPQLYIGSTEFDGYSSKEIYLDIMSTPWLKGSEDIIGGIYYGHEDENLEANMKKVSMFIHGEGKKLVWIPYVSDNRPIQTIIYEYAYQTISGRTDTNKVVPEGTPLFDFIIVQPGTYYNGKTEHVDDFKKVIREYYTNPEKAPVARVGFEMEFDMGVVTGRQRTGDQFTPLQKRDFLNQYLDMYDELQGMGIPVGVYSGGPNEQGYGNIVGNHNTHNSGNHVAYWEGIDETAYAYGVPYDQFPSAYAGGNAIYDINNYLYNGIWNPALTESLWLDPR